MIGRPPIDKNIGLLQEIEALSRALAAPISSNSKPKSSSSSSSQKKSSFWNWKPLKALSHIRQRRLDCVFSLHVHSIENLPTDLGDVALSVHWKRTSDSPSSATGTSSVHAFNGVAEFEETLTYRCSVYGARKSSSNPSAKYEARHFLIYASLSDSPVVDIGKQTVDVTRLLPLTFDELDVPENRSGKWSTSFRLSGKCKGASLNVSFGFMLVDERSTIDSLNLKMRDDRSVGKVRDKGRQWSRSQSMDDVRVLHEILPSSKSDASFLAHSIDKFKTGDCEVREMCDSQMGMKPKCKDELVTFSEKIDDEGLNKGMQIHSEEMEERGMPSHSEEMEEKGMQIHSEEMEEKGMQIHSEEMEEKGSKDCDHKEIRLLSDDNQTAMEDAPHSETLMHVVNHDTHVRTEHEDECRQSNYLTFDEAEAVAMEFLSMLAVDHGPSGLTSECDVESPRAQLLKQFQEETIDSCCLSFDLTIETEHDYEPCDAYNLSDELKEFDLSLMVDEAERELYDETHGLTHYSRAKLMENDEAEVLMRKWGLNERAFQQPSTEKNCSLNSPIDHPCKEPLKLPCLGEGLSDFVQTKDGGFLRSMRPTLFESSNGSAPLIMQVSSPVVVPAEMGSDIMEILHRFASVGTEKLSLQAKKLMPLEDVAGKTMDQLGLDGCRIETDAVISQKSSPSSSYDRDSEYVSVKDLAPLAMDKIEALSMEGLRIQSGMSDEELAGPNTHSSLELKGSAELQLLDDGNEDVDGLMNLSISLDEWVRLDSGIAIAEDQTSDRRSKILAAHRSSSSNSITKQSDERWGLLGSNFTVALMVQLRDPLRNFDPVGIPMLALVQVERFLTPPNPKPYVIVSEKNENSEEGDHKGEDKKVEMECSAPQFKITNVHIAGLETKPNKKSVWGNPMQQQSGSRWLLANGMGKKSKHPLMKSKPLLKASQGDDALWSISSEVYGNGSKWKEMLAMDSYIRNPNVHIPTKAMR